ncbi:hypothetical protein CDAR_286851 [Caerostris darwini]|uniref:Uncharacterized protein n=1 Tax=Caerostris darwini TaxID=1538125 RepID=A0AAV4R9L2_9ARAC|nr:hypothetical protein CDAR_286851 [Caerostris darwini]
MKRSSSCRSSVRERIAFYWSVFSAGVFLGFVSGAIVLRRVEFVTALRTLYRFQQRTSAIERVRSIKKLDNRKDNIFTDSINNGSKLKKRYLTLFAIVSLIDI